MTKNNPFGLDLRTITDHYAGEVGYYDFKQTALAHPNFLKLLLEEMKTDDAVRAHFRRKSGEVAVYFIQQETDGPIKIGASRNVEARVKTLRTGSHVALNLLGVTAGGFDLERALHHELSDFQLEGEWFSPTPEVFAAINRHL